MLNNKNYIYIFKSYKKKFLKFIIITIAILTVISYFYIFKHRSEFKLSEIYQIFFTSLIVISFILIFYQIYTQIDWNRRQYTSTELKYFIKDNSNARNELNKLFDYSSRIHNEEEKPFTVDEIHNLICEKGEDGKFKSATNDSSNKPYILTEEGHKIRKNIIRILNNFEQIASNIFHNVYDEDMCKDLLYKSVIQNYKLYHIYISHLRGKDHYNDENALEKFEWLAHKWQKKSEKTKRDEL